MENLQIASQPSLLDYIRVIYIEVCDYGCLYIGTITWIVRCDATWLFIVNCLCRVFLIVFFLLISYFYRYYFRPK